MRHCWLRLRRHVPGKTWDGYCYRYAECRVCARWYAWQLLRADCGPR